MNATRAVLFGMAAGVAMRASFLLVGAFFSAHTFSHQFLPCRVALLLPCRHAWI